MPAFELEILARPFILYFLKRLPMEELMILASIELHVEEGHLNSAVVILAQDFFNSSSFFLLMLCLLL